MFKDKLPKKKKNPPLNFNIEYIFYEVRDSTHAFAQEETSYKGGRTAETFFLGQVESFL